MATEAAWYAVRAGVVVCAVAVQHFGWHVRNPVLSEYRPWPLLGALGAGVLLTLAAVVLARRRNAVGLGHRLLSGLAVAMSSAALAAPLLVELGHQWDRRTVERSAPERIAILGQHLIAGFNDWDEITAHVERRAVGGVFVRRHNVAGLSGDEIARRIETLQAIRRRQLLPLLWVATDQEGGRVARLSPPLAPQPTLRDAIGQATSPQARRDIVKAYATLQARGLAGLGVNLNFAPVVDLDWGIVNPEDQHTRINARVVSRDPVLVGDIAATYCAALAAQRVHCTLKHFPGIGRVFEDTHRQPAALGVPLAELETTDLVPFRRVLADGDAAAVLMMSHVLVTALDKDDPASRSAAVVQRYIRDAWGFDGVIVTDDLCMGAIYESGAGIGVSGVRALNAGVDLVLIAWDSSQYYSVMAALLRAQARGRLDDHALGLSRQRLAKALAGIGRR